MSFGPLSKTGLGQRQTNNEVSFVSLDKQFEDMKTVTKSHAQIPRSQVVDTEVEAYMPSTLNFKIPSQISNHREVSKNLDRLRE